MEQNRPKGPDKNRILQAVLLLAICIWLLYLINDSHHKQENDNVNTEYLSKRNLTSALGRKGLTDYTTGGKAETHGKNATGELENAGGEYEIDANIDEDTERVLKLEEEEEETRVLNGKREATEAEFLRKQLYNVTVVNTANQYSEMEILDDYGEDVLRVEAFPDENGIPPDATYFISSTEPRGSESRVTLLDIQDDGNTKRTQNIIKVY